MPNRSVRPPITNLSTVVFPEYKESSFNGQIPFIHLHSSNYEVVKIEFVFNAGRLHERKRMVSKATHMMLKSGTSKMSSAEINDKIDFYGASIGLRLNFDSVTIGLYCLSKYVQEMIPFVLDLLSESTFPEKEFEFYKEQEHTKLKIALSKVDNLAFRTITEQIFGPTHPYGYNTIASDIDNLSRDLLIEHHERLYTANNCKIYICGNLKDSDFRIMENEVKRLKDGRQSAPQMPKANGAKPGVTCIPMKDKVQMAIRIGRKTFNRRHKDFKKVYLFGVFLGGYFGSRLSMKIREEKGYTYGIHTTMDAMLHDGFFMVSTEVAKEYVDLTLAAIYEELADLRKNLVTETELKQMKNYLQGYFLGCVDGVFKSSRVLKGLQETGVDKRYFEELQEALDSFSPQDIQEVAKAYFQKEDLYEVVVG